MKIIKALEAVHLFFNNHIQPIHKITKIESCDSGWEACVEVVEEKDYMIAHAKDQLLGEYAVSMDKELNIISFKRISLRSRSSIPE